MSQALIEFRDVHKSFGDNAVLKGVNLCIPEGQVTTIIGKSGIGKSVLLKHIIGLLEPDAGTILFSGLPLNRLPRAERRRLKMNFSYMFQGTALFDSMTVYENVALPLVEGRRFAKKEIRKRVKEKLEQLDLVGMEDKYPSQLSGGMMKRVAMARALVTEPQIVLFDEPTTGLDPVRKNAAHNMIVDYQRRFGFTAVLVSHDIPDVFRISQKVAMLDDGKIIFEGTAEDLQQSSDPTIRAFLDGHDRIDGDERQ